MPICMLWAPSQSLVFVMRFQVEEMYDTSLSCNTLTPVFFSLPVCDCIDKVRYIRFLCGLLPPLVSLALLWTPHCLRLLPSQVEGSSTWWFASMQPRDTCFFFFFYLCDCWWCEVYKVSVCPASFSCISRLAIHHVTLFKRKEHIPRDTFFFFPLGCDYVLVVWGM